MTTLDEALGPQPQFAQRSTPIHDALAAGVAVLSGDQKVSFTPYIRTVLPIDGFVFWLKAAVFNDPVRLSGLGLQSADPIEVDGSLHYASVGTQEEDQSIVVRKVDLTAMSPVPALATAAPNVLWVGTWKTDFPPGEFRFTFSARNQFYEEAGVSHFIGDAVYPVFEQQLIDSIADFSTRQVVSNSLPIWLAMCTEPAFPVDLVSIDFPIFPAFLVYENQTGQYAAVDISGTRAVQPTPALDRRGNQWQLMTERVRFTLYGMRNDEAQDFLLYLIRYCEFTDLFGFREMPVIVDDRRAQVELAALAQRKSVEMAINYYQTRARDVARELIQSAPLTVTRNPVPVRSYPPPAYQS